MNAASISQFFCSSRCNCVGVATLRLTEAVQQDFNRNGGLGLQELKQPPRFKTHQQHAVAELRHTHTHTADVGNGASSKCQHENITHNVPILYGVVVPLHTAYTEYICVFAVAVYS